MNDMTSSKSGKVKTKFAVAAEVDTIMIARKTSRTDELRQEISKIESAGHAAVGAIALGADKKRKQLLTEVTGKVYAIKKETDGRLDPIRKAREMVLRQADKTREEAVRKAHGDYERAKQRAELTYAADRDRVNEESAEACAPLEVQLAEGQLAIREEARAAILHTREEADAALAPLKRELAEIEAKLIKTSKLVSGTDAPPATVEAAG